MVIAPPSQPRPSQEESDGLRLLLVALAAAVLFHGGLLPFTHENTYDAFIHMFFGDSYHRSWFDPWEPRWYTGFLTTSYPPGTHMAIAALQNVLTLRAAFVVVMLCGILLLTLGVFRFAQIWVPGRSAGYAALATVLASSVSETIHLFGQLPTIFSLGIFLNGLPFVFRWLVGGGWFNFGAAIAFGAGTTAAHHVTTIFGGVLFILPLGLFALSTAVANSAEVGRARWRSVLAPIGRGLLLAICLLAAIIVTVLPYWLWSINDPITQVSIPHGSRESFVDRPDLGLIFFVIPWGISLFFLPYAFWKAATSRLWPLGLSLALSFVLGTGGTTPIPKMILGGAFDILTLDRFTFWATILILPFTGLLFDGLLHGRSGAVLIDTFGRTLYRLLVGGAFSVLTLGAVMPALLPALQPVQPKFVDPAPIVRFMAEDEHDRWRYLTLGFGDQFAYLSAKTDAKSVDGNYHSARRLPDLTRFSVERLENAKYMGVPGLGSLRQFLVNAEQYHLKYVFSNDAFYDPILHFSGWTQLLRLPNNVVVWEKPDVPPLPLMERRRDIAPLHVAMWGTIPPSALVLVAVLLAITILRPDTVGYRHLPVAVADRADHFRSVRKVRLFVQGILLAGSVAAGVGGGKIHATLSRPPSDEDVIQGYFNDLDLRQFEAAYQKIDPETRASFEDIQFQWRWTGGLIRSYGKLSGIELEKTADHGRIADWAVELTWLTALGERTETLDVRVVNREGRWYLAPTVLRPVQNPVRIQRETAVTWTLAGRRQPRAETDLHRDRMDRPEFQVSGARLIRRNQRYHVVGEMTNTDTDPAILRLNSSLIAGADAMVTEAAGKVSARRLLPAESGGFRVDFQGVLSLEDALEGGGYDPDLFIPPVLSGVPDASKVEASALVTGVDLYRGISLNAVTVTHEGAQVVIRGLAVNSGTKTATIAALNVLLYDPAGQPLWADTGFVDSNIYPGQSAPFRIDLPLADEIEVIAEIETQDILVNGREMTEPRRAGQAGMLPVPPSTGYGGLHLHVSTMTHEPLF